MENVLKHGNLYKLCDFGSATTKTFLPENSSSINRIEDELNRYTTAAYRSPEMVDLWRMQFINEKVDVWALGCLLYRICFFVHPFDEGGSLQILNVNYEIPGNSPYSQELHKFIQYMIEPDPDKRPTVFQVIERLSSLRGVPNTTRSPTVSHMSQQTQQRNSPQNSSSSRTKVAPKAPATTMDAFALLDWHDSPGTTGRTNSGDRTVQHNTPAPVTTAKAAPIDDFADFSNANFASAAPAAETKLHQDTSFFAAPEAQEQLQSNSPVTSAPASPFLSHNVPTQTPISPQTPTNKMRSSQPLADIRSSFSSLNSPNTPAQSLTSSQGTYGSGSNDLFSNFQSPAPQTNNNANFTNFQTPQSQMSHSFDFAAFGSNQSSTGVNMQGNNMNSFAGIGNMNNAGTMNGNMGMNHLQPAMNTQHTRHSSFGMQGNT